MSNLEQDPTLMTITDTATVTILNDDNATVTISDNTTLEDSGPTVTLSGQPSTGQDSGQRSFGTMERRTPGFRLYRGHGQREFCWQCQRTRR